MDARRNRFLSALRGEPLDRPPVWLMRQAGRYLPGYRAVRKQHQFWDVCRTPELSTQVALEPLNAFKVDAAIVFSDILVVPDALGFGVSFGSEGPKLSRTLSSAADVDNFRTRGVAERLAFVSDAVRHLAVRLNGSHGLVGFSGAPFTLFAYCVEGSGGGDFMHARAFLHRHPKAAHRALTILADVSAEYLDAQCAAGADVVQLFDSWGGLLDVDDYRTFAVPALRRVTDALRARGRTTLLFVRGAPHLLALLAETGADGFSLDWRIGWAEARAQHPQAILQGNIDPALLLAGVEAVVPPTKALLATMHAHHQSRRCIVNLGHGIHKDTAPEAVAALCDEVAASA